MFKTYNEAAIFAGVENADETTAEVTTAEETTFDETTAIQEITTVAEVTTTEEIVTTVAEESSTEAEKKSTGCGGIITFSLVLATAPIAIIAFRKKKY